jgi:hypothetical protein
LKRRRQHKTPAPIITQQNVTGGKQRAMYKKPNYPARLHTQITQVAIVTASFTVGRVVSEPFQWLGNGSNDCTFGNKVQQTSNQIIATWVN